MKEINKIILFKILALVLIFSSTSLKAVTCTPTAVDPTTTDVYENVSRLSFVDGSVAAIPNVPVSMDIYKPTGVTPTEAVVILHGNNEDKGGTRYVNLCKAFAARGILAVSINNRIDIMDLPGTLNSLHALGNPNSLDVNNRIFYSNAMDMHNAIKRIKVLYPTVTKFILGGASRGGASTMYASYVDKSEISSSFPATFMTDNVNYIDMSVQKPSIKGSFIFFGGIFNINWIGSNENIPLFVYHGTNDPNVPIYYSTCPLPVYGGASIVQRLDVLNKKFYFIEARGLGHVTSICTFENLWTATGFEKLWFADLFNFVYKSMINTAVVQKYKIITPNNGAYNYCNWSALNPNCGGGGTTACFVALPGSFSLTHNVPLSATNPCSLPAIYSNTYSATNCYCNNGTCSSTPGGTNYGRQANPNPTQTETKAASLPLMYPNPTTGKLNINYKLDKEINGYNVSIFSVDGRSIYSNVVSEKLEAETVLSKEFDISAQPNGVYFIRITSENNVLLNKTFILNK
jgi:hypothetical protein